MITINDVSTNDMNFKHLDTTKNIVITPKNEFGGQVLLNTAHTWTAKVSDDTNYVGNYPATLGSNSIVVNSAGFTKLPAGQYYLEVWEEWTDANGNNQRSIYPSPNETIPFRIYSNVTDLAEKEIKTIGFQDVVDQAVMNIGMNYVFKVNVIEPDQTATVVQSAADGKNYVTFNIPQGLKGDPGKPFSIAKIFPSKDALSGDGLSEGDLVMIASNVNDPNNADLYAWTGKEFKLIADLSGTQGIQGPQGAQGPKGDTGATGPAGPQGPKGDKGDVGPIGPKGDKGDTGLQGKDGAQGPKGDKGDTGLQGKDGAQGPKGDKGDTGLPGKDGAQGPKGDKGDKGDTGTVDNAGLTTAPAFAELKAQVNNSAVGTNLLRNSRGKFQPGTSTIDNNAVYLGPPAVSIYMTQGQQYTVHADASSGLVWSGTHNPTVESNNAVLWLTDGADSWKIISDANTGTGTTFTWNNPSGTYYLRVNTYKIDNSGYVENIKIEPGSVATPWCPNPSEIMTKSDYAKIQAAIVALGGSLK